MAQGDDSYEQSVSSPEPTAAVAAGGVAGSVVDAAVVEAAFAAAAVGLCVLDPVGRILRANPRWLSWMGTSLEAAQGRSVWELFPEAPPGLRALHERARGGETLALPAIRRVVDDRAAWLEGRLSPVQLPGGGEGQHRERPVGLEGGEPPCGLPGTVLGDVATEHDQEPGGAVLAQPERGVQGHVERPQVAVVDADALHTEVARAPHLLLRA